MAGSVPDAGPVGRSSFREGTRGGPHVHRLRRQYGIQIETIRRRERGTFPGTRSTFILKDVVVVLFRPEPEDKLFDDELDAAYFDDELDAAYLDELS
jgi:hypothetical protein